MDSTVVRRDTTPAAITVGPDAITLWVGDTATLVATLSDVEGLPVASSPMRWMSSAPPVARVADGVVVALEVGEATVRVRSGALEAVARVTVLPVIAGRIVSTVHDDLAGLRLLARVGERLDSVDVAPDGRFALRLLAPARASADVCVSAVSPEAEQFHPLRVRVPPRFFRSLRAVLVPTRWMIDAGRFTGQTVEIRPELALRRASDGGGFWRLTRPIEGGTLGVAWPGGTLPIPVAFRHRAGGRVAGADSADFWRLVSLLESDVGRRLFRPASYEDVADEPDAVIVEVNPGMIAAGRTFISWNQRGNAYDALVTFQSTALLRDERVVLHEMLHALGLGHTSAWRSVMGTWAPGLSRPTPTDVAYTQLLYAVHSAQRVHEASFGILESLPGANTPRDPCASLRPQVALR